MFSLDRFYNILHDNLISQFPNGQSFHFYPFGTYQQLISIIDKSAITVRPEFRHSMKTFVHCYFFDQEPIYNYTVPILEKSRITPDHVIGPRRLNLFANSEHSEIKTQLVKEQGFYDWYYFFHGFAALDWYRDFQYMNPSSFNRYDKVFICYNHLISKLRSYRLHLVSNMIDQDLIKHGRVSLCLKDGQGTWQNTLVDQETPLDNRARIKIHQVLKNVAEPLIIDTAEPNGSLSATVNFEDLTSALWHVVTETVYFLPKLHLTEKIFKPIIAKRPFILVGAPGNLAYLKSYGFKTFDRWIDESYDQEQDHYIRIEKITAELAKLCAMPPALLKQMHQDMQSVLEHNFQHFYGSFKTIIVNELVDNFAGILGQVNNGRVPGNHSRFHHRFELDPEYLTAVKLRLLN